MNSWTQGLIDQHRREIEEYHQLTTRQAELLTGVANALKGPPPDLVMWDHSNLPYSATLVMEILREVHGLLTIVTTQRSDARLPVDPSVERSLRLIERVLPEYAEVNDD